MGVGLSRLSARGAGDRGGGETVTERQLCDCVNRIMQRSKRHRIEKRGGKLVPQKAKRSPRSSAKSKKTADRELAILAQAGGAFDWMDDPAEDIYTVSDGKPALWPA